MKTRFALAAAVSAVLLPISVRWTAQAAGPFESKLPADRQNVQALNRLTFGPRPGDVEEIRRIGYEKWIDLQLHPDRVTENPVLGERLKPYETLRMDTAEVLRDYIQPQMMQIFRQPNLNTLLPQEQMRRVMNGTAEERKAALDSLDPAKLQQVLVVLPPNSIADLPEYKKAAEDARKAQADARQAEQRKMNPPLADLLSPEQMAITRKADPAALKALLDSLDERTRAKVAAALPMALTADYPELRREGQRMRMPQQLPVTDRTSGKILRAIYSNRQLEEVLVDFWFNHFNVFENKNVQNAGLSFSSLVTGYERDAIRPHVLGHFKDLVLAVAQHPAMLYYLDNWQSMASDTDERRNIGPFAGPFLSGIGGSRPVNPNQPHGLNENYGRELMELHTMGVNGGYAQKDVIEVARCFTGWTVTKPQAPAFVFVSDMHDDGEKTVLGHKIAAGGGMKDGLQVIDILVHHPSTARFISKQLAQRFVADEPPQSLIDRMALTFTKTDGDLRAVLLTMFNSTEFLSEGAWQAKIKSPFEFIVSAVRATEAKVLDPTMLTGMVSNLGEPLYRKVEPNGYPLTADGWLGTADLVGRLNFVTMLVSKMGSPDRPKVDTARWDGKDAVAISRDLLGRAASPETMTALASIQDPPQIAQLILDSPDFNRR